MSNRLGETGTVVVRVLIGADGTAQKAEIQRSSGFARLDKAALDAVLGWRYVPGKRGGVPEAMWYTVPIKWGLEDQ
jgi:protein TonB